MDPGVKQQVVERIKQAENILVTISNNPSIDQLAACIGFTLMLNKMGKRGTAIYSGKTPPILDFLQPEKTLEANTDSLQDFIISLDKAKADKLRYKVEDQVVRIFITPYKTSLSEKDLIFGHGDFNVDVVVVLGVQERAHLDKVIAAHGRILHDATVVTVNTQNGKGSDLGQLNWHDPTASSISEMLVSISEAFGTGLIDNQMATAFLTGIVAETDRFGNDKTSPKVMTMSAQLMAAGANQKLVISKLEPPPPPPPPPPPKPKSPPPPLKFEEPANKNAPAKPKEESKKEEKTPPPEKRGELNVAHENTEADGSEVQIDSTEIHIDPQGNIQAIDGSEDKAPPQKDSKKPENTSKPQGDSKPKAAEPEVVPKIELEAPPPSLPPPQAAPEVKLPEPTPVAPLPDLPPVPLPPVPSSTPSIPPKQPTPEPSVFPEHNAMTSFPAPPPPPQVQYSPPESEPHAHAVMDPSQKPPAFGTAFSADTGQGGWSGGLPVDPLNIDPVNNVNPNENYDKDHKKVAPPPPQQTPIEQLLAQQNSSPTPPPPPTPTAAAPNPATGVVDDARSAVANAYAAAPFDPSLNPVASLGSQQMGPDLHTASVPPASQEVPPSQDQSSSFPPTPPPSIPPPMMPPPSL